MIIRLKRHTNKSRSKTKIKLQYLYVNTNYCQEKKSHLIYIYIETIKTNVISQLFRVCPREELHVLFYLVWLYSYRVCSI